MCVCVCTHSCNSLSLAHVGAGRVKSRKWIESVGSEGVLNLVAAFIYCCIVCSVSCPGFRLIAGDCLYVCVCVCA